MNIRTIELALLALVLFVISTEASAQRISDVTVKNDAQDVHIHVHTTTPRNRGWKGIRLMIDTDSSNRYFEYQYNEHEGPYSARYDARSGQWHPDALPRINRVNDSHWVYIFNRKKIGIGHSGNISIKPLLLLNSNEEFHDYTYSYTMNDVQRNDYTPLIVAGIGAMALAYLFSEMTTPSSDEKRRRCRQLVPGDISWTTLGCGS